MRDFLVIPILATAGLAQARLNNILEYVIFFGKYFCLQIKITVENFSLPVGLLHFPPARSTTFHPIAPKFISYVIPLFQLFSRCWRVFPSGKGRQQVTV